MGKRINDVKVFLGETQQTRYVYTEKTWAEPRNGWRGQGKFVASSPLALIRNSPNDARFCRRDSSSQRFGAAAAKQRKHEEFAAEDEPPETSPTFLHAFLPKFSASAPAENPPGEENLDPDS